MSDNIHNAAPDLVEFLNEQDRDAIEQSRVTWLHEQSVFYTHAAEDAEYYGDIRSGRSLRRDAAKSEAQSESLADRQRRRSECARWGERAMTDPNEKQTQSAMAAYLRKMADAIEAGDYLRPLEFECKNFCEHKWFTHKRTEEFPPRDIGSTIILRFGAQRDTEKHVDEEREQMEQIKAGKFSQLMPKFTKHFVTGSHEARTLDPLQVTDTKEPCGEHTKTHASGWTITGVVHEDYYYWVNDFSAVHPELGRVWGNFENDVHADSEAAFEHFYANHEPRDWDYFDI